MQINTITKTIAIISTLTFSFIAMQNQTNAADETPSFEPKYLKGDAEKGKMKYMVCMSCHGPTGGGNIIFKSAALPGQQDWYLQSQLQKFKLGMRGTKPGDIAGMQMRAMSMTLATEQDMADVVAYIKTFPPVVAAPTLKGDLAKGKATFEKICIECHGPKALGLKEKQSPSLMGLTDWYIITQVKNVQNGLRGYAPNDKHVHEMKEKIATITDEQTIIDVALYILSLQEAQAK
jgi:cytochrome c oxidase subunit 2